MSIPNRLRPGVIVCGLIALPLTAFLTGCGPDTRACNEYYEDGTLALEANCSETGALEGEVRAYYPNGNLKSVRHFVEDREQDTAYHYHRDGEHLQRIQPMENDLAQGRVQWFRKDGTLEKEADFILGQLHGEELYYHPDGQQIREKNSYQYGQLYGPHAQYDSVGNPIVEGTYYNRQKFDQWTYFKPGGKISHSLSFYYDQKQGAFAVYRPSGTPYVTGNFTNDYLDGEVKIYNRQGAIIGQETWIRGERIQRRGGGQPQTVEQGVARFRLDGREITISGDTVRVR